jgi:Undecaprenyl-phosphate glucose phosphotransferase
MPGYFFRYFPKIFIVIDYLIINLLFFSGKLYFFNFSDNDTFVLDYRAQFIILNFSWLIIANLTGLYKSSTFKESSLQFNALTKSLLLFVIFSLIYLSLIFPKNINYANCFLYFLLIGASTFVARLILFLYRKKHRVKIGRMLYQFDTVLIGENNFAQNLLTNSEIRRSIGIKGVYAFDHEKASTKYLGNIDDLIREFDDLEISKLIFCDDRIKPQDYKTIIELAENKMVRVYMVPDFKHNNPSLVSYEMLANIPFLVLMKEPLSERKKQIIKRSFDILFSLFVIVFLLSWLIPIVALIIKLESRGPVFFLQKRSGLKNKAFNCIKFRSMTVNDVADLKIAEKGDRRITKFGEFMRKTSIDELPQFINVFIGNMSVVGPRPHMLSQTRQYSKITKKYMLRHMIKPGITGWAQVMGSRGEIFSNRDMELRVEKDIWYIQNWSFFLDLKIIFLTFYNIVKGDEQAY